MRAITTSTALAPFLGLGLLALAACAQMEPTTGPTPLGTERQPTASPEEVQDERPQAQEPEGGPIQ